MLHYQNHFLLKQELARLTQYQRQLYSHINKAPYGSAKREMYELQIEVCSNLIKNAQEALNEA